MVNQRNPVDFVDRKELLYSHSTDEFPPSFFHDENGEFLNENTSFSVKNEGFTTGNAPNVASAGKTSTVREHECVNKYLPSEVSNGNGRQIDRDDIEKLRKKNQMQRNRSNSAGLVNGIVKEVAGDKVRQKEGKLQIMLLIIAHRDMKSFKLISYLQLRGILLISNASIL